MVVSANGNDLLRIRIYAKTNLLLNRFFPFLGGAYSVTLLKQSNKISGDSAVYYISRRFNLNETEI